MRCGGGVKSTLHKFEVSFRNRISKSETVCTNISLLVCDAVARWMGTNVTYEHSALTSRVKMKAPGTTRITVEVSNELHAITPYKTVICKWRQHKILNSGVWQIRCRMGHKWTFTYLVIGKQKEVTHNLNWVFKLQFHLYFDPKPIFSSPMQCKNTLLRILVYSQKEKYYICISCVTEFQRLYTHHFNKTCLF